MTQERAAAGWLTVAWINREALKKTVQTGEAHYWSRSRKKLWRKGEESGYVQKISRSGSIATKTSCCWKSSRWAVSPVTPTPFVFFQKLDRREMDCCRPGAEGSHGHLQEQEYPPVTDTDILRRLGAVIAQRRRADPSSSYVASLFAKGEDAIMKKVARRRRRRCWQRRTVINCMSCVKPPTSGFTVWCCLRGTASAPTTCSPNCGAARVRRE